MRRLFVLIGMFGCGGGADFYQSCDLEEPDACADVVPEETSGVCLEKSGGGFCTWECATDAECAEDVDEDYDFVCAPLESNPQMYCFPACGVGDDGGESCPDGYGCRSTGGGSDNRKICFPDGA